MPPPAATPSRPHAWRRWLGAALALLALVLAFTLYSQPGFVLMLADQVWACF